VNIILSDYQVERPKDRGAKGTSEREKVDDKNL